MISLRPSSTTDCIVYSVTGLALYGFADLLRKYIEWRTSPLRQIPSPTEKTSFLFGYFFQIFREPFMDPHKRWIKQVRDTTNNKEELPFISYSWLLGRSSLLILDCELIKLILTDSYAKEPVRFPKKYAFIAKILGDGLVSLEGESWARHRRIIQPSFQTNQLKLALNNTVPSRVQVLVDAWKKAGEGAIIDLSSHMSALTLDVIGCVAFSHDFNATKIIQEWAENNNQEELNRNQTEQKLADVSDPMIKAFNESFKVSLTAILLDIFKMAWLTKYVNRKAARTNVVLNEAVDDIIREARSNTTEDETEGSKSLIQLLFDAKDSEAGDKSNRKYLSDLELRDEAKTFIVAGHETTSTWCYWALYALARYPDVQQKVFDDIIKHAPDTSKPINLDQVDKMEYLYAFLQEILRLYTPVGMIFRYTSQVEHWKGYTIPADTRLVLPIHLMHRHPDHWVKPEEFRPERWLDKDEMEKRNKFCFFPFSIGGRNCIGQRFAEIEAKIIVANVARSFRIQLAPTMRDQEITFTNYISMKSKPLIKICVKSR